MSPVTTTTLVEQIRRLVAYPRQRLKAWFPTGLPRWLWTLFQVLALALAVIGVVYAWREFPPDVAVAPVFLGSALGLYALAFLMHLLGWHSLTRIFFGRLTFAENAQALAGSNLVKYLPTVVWYIANRSHFYHQRGVAQQRVVIASLSELALMVGSGAVLLAALWVGRTFAPFAGGLLGLVGLGVLIWALARHAGGSQQAPLGHWSLALLWYGGSWPVGVLIVWSLLRALVPVSFADLPTLAEFWLLAGLASYTMSLTLGTIGIMREITLTMLLAQYWPLPVALAAAIMVKLVLTLGEVGLSLLILGGLRLWPHDRPKGGARE